MNSTEINIILELDSSGNIKSYQVTSDISKKWKSKSLSKVVRDENEDEKLKCSECSQALNVCLYIPSEADLEVQVKQEGTETAWEEPVTKNVQVEVGVWSPENYVEEDDVDDHHDDGNFQDDDYEYVPKKKKKRKVLEAKTKICKKITVEEPIKREKSPIQNVPAPQAGPSGEFSCNICHKDFRNKLSLSTHKRYCTTERLNTTCESCSKTYKTFYDFRTHMETVHGVNPRHQCHECGRAFISPCKLEEHILHKHDKIRHTCTVCGKDFTNKYVLQNHMKEKHNIDISIRRTCNICVPIRRFQGDENYVKHLFEDHGITDMPDDLENETDIKQETEDDDVATSKLPPKKKIKHESDCGRKDFTCRACNAIFKNKMSLSAHRRYCNPDMPRIGKPTCKYCGKIYSTWYTVKDHIKTEHEKIFLQCELCGKQLKNKSDLTEHLLRHKDPKPFICHFCEKRFVNKDRVKIHILQKHLGQANYICEICSKPFVMESEMNKHKAIVHSDARPFPCAHCPKSFKTEFYLKNHIYSMHTPDELKPKFQCTVCDFVTTKPHYLEQHQRNHMDESQKLPCSYCGKRFVDNSQKEKHEMIHTGERPFHCGSCEQAFKTRVEYREHYIKAHTNDRPFQCEVCQDAFADRWQYRNHLNRHEAELGVTLNKSVRHFMFKYKDL